ncbi:MAG: hypothetical protein VB085_12290 [Peptococcaceae bacterium]|nr:hypothetical protein [Peptococcaceae bacterium]
MNQERLKQYQTLQREIKQLERQIVKLRAVKDRPGVMVADSVQASRSQYPYRQYRTVITGWADGEDPAEWRREIEDLEARLRESKRRCQRELWGLSRYIESRPDSEDRQLLRMRYIEGMSLMEIGEEMHADRSVIGKRLKKLTG